MRRLKFQIFSVMLLCLWSLATPPVRAQMNLLQPKFQQIRNINQPALMVVHASYEFDVEGTAREFIDAEIRKFKARGLPVIYLVSDLSKEGLRNWYTEDRAPDYLIYSAGGEHNLPLRNADITVVGGFFGNYDTHNGCHTQALRNVVDSYYRLQKQTAPLTVHLPISSIYFWPNDELVRISSLKKFDRSSDWLPQLATMLFSADFSLTDEQELGRAFFFRSKTPVLVKNPFLDVVVGSKEYSADEDPDSPLGFVSENGRATARDGRYKEADPVTLKKYQFHLSTTADAKAYVFGSGREKVRFLFEK